VHAADHGGGGGNAGRIAAALAATLGLMAVEIVAGLRANSLALLSDAGHNLTDAVTLVLTWAAIRWSRQPAHSGKTFGYHRAGILVALVNSTTLALVGIGIIVEAVRRIGAPPVVNSRMLIGVGAAAFAVNAGTAWMIRHGSRHDLNVRSAFFHLAGDAVSTAGAVLAGLVISATGFQWIDPAVSLLIGGLVLFNAWGVIRETVEILLESTPSDIGVEDLVADIRRVPGVRGVHDLHIWSLTAGLRALSAHLVTDDVAVSEGVRIQKGVRAVLEERYSISHVTLQLECADCGPDGLFCDMEDLKISS
jgi:cobalt-zinc-cadmium efflux system protein